MLKNRSLFASYKRMGKTLMRGKNDLFLPDDEPWETLSKVLNHLSRHTSPPAVPWPRLPAACKLGDEAHGVIESFGSIHVRGGETLKSDENTKIKGPVILGKGVILRKGAVITGPCLIGNGVIIGVGCRIKHSILFPGSHIVYGTRISYSIIGSNARIGPGAVSEEESFSSREEPWSKDLPRIGFFAGDDAWVGGGSVISPAVVLGKKCRIKEGTVLETGEYSGSLNGRPSALGNRK